MERALTWRHGLVPWTGLLTLAAVAVGLNLAVATSSVEVLGWVLIGVATLVLLVRPSCLVERLPCIPRWCLALMIVLHVVAVLVAPRGGKGWFVLADGLLLVGAAAVAR